jgi:hypothetical protein
MTEDMRPALSVPEFAMLANISRPAAYAAIKDGIVPHFRFSRGRKGGIRIPREPALRLLRGELVETTDGK